MSLRAAIAPQISQFSLSLTQGYVRNWRSSFNRLIQSRHYFFICQCETVRLRCVIYFVSMGNAPITGNAIAQDSFYIVCYWSNKKCVCTMYIYQKSQLEIIKRKLINAEN